MRVWPINTGGACGWHELETTTRDRGLGAFDRFGDLSSEAARMSYQTITTDGFLITRTSAGYAIARAGLGDGYDAAINLGEVLHKWSIKIDALPDFPGVAPLVGTDTRAAYLWDFFMARKAEGDAPFWLQDPKDDQMYLAAFVDDALGFDVLRDQAFAAGLELIQRRVKDTATPVPPP